jgi:predicted amidohydrolase YtcJ
MCNNHRHISRRDFLKFGALALGGATLACGKKDEIVRLTASIAPDATLAPPTSLGAGEFADTILVNGRLYTMDAAQPSAQALAVKDGNILQVGSDEAIRALTGEATHIIDLAGKTATPGFIDAHNHLQVFGSLLDRFVPLLPPEIRTLDSLLAKLKTSVDEANPGEWVQAIFWETDPIPTKFDLDPISPDNPVWVMQQGGHYGIANSKAMDIAGITPETENPVGGIIQRNESGELTGMFYNHKAMDLLRVHAPIPTKDDMLQYIRAAGDLFVAAGVTTFYDNNVRFSALDAYVQAGTQRVLTPRGQIYYTLEWPADLERALKEMPTIADDFMRFAGYKFLIDGQFPTWFTHEPHPGISWDMPTWDPKLFKRAVSQLHDTGLQISIHTGGDAAVDLALDAIEEAMNANPRPDPRHRIEHAVLTTPEATQRFVDLGVHICCQPQFLRFAAYVGDKLGEDRASRLKVTREWLDAGVNVSISSDAGSTPWYRPQVTLLGAVTRLGPDDKSFHPEQAMTIDEALHAHTIAAARCGHEDHIKGSLTAGKFADLVVWNDDYYSVDPMDIVKVDSELTMIGGEIVHEG